jgi:hypothetical protein
MDPTFPADGGFQGNASDSCYTQEHKNTPCIRKVCVLMFSVILKWWMKSYARRNASTIVASYTHPILHILAYVAILRDPTTVQNESLRCVCTCTRVIMLCVYVHMLEYNASMTAAVLRNTKILPVYEKYVY